MVPVPSDSKLVSLTILPILSVLTSILLSLLLESITSPLYRLSSSIVSSTMRSLPGGVSRSSYRSVYNPLSNELFIATLIQPPLKLSVTSSEPSNGTQKKATSSRFSSCPIRRGNTTLSVKAISSKWHLSSRIFANSCPPAPLLFSKGHGQIAHQLHPSRISVR